MTIQKDATRFTKAANKALLSELNWDDCQDFESASRGFIATSDSPLITDANGKLVWDLNAWSFLDKEAAPPTVNPSLWRQSRLNALYHGLFKVTEGVYQIRSFDTSTMSIIETETGYVVIDPLVSTEVAQTGMELVYRHIGRKPVVAVVYTHTHIDHWGGVKGVISESEVKSGSIKVIAPENFLKYMVSENVIAGNVMARRVSLIYGNVLPRNERGNVGFGLAQAVSYGLSTFIEPTDYVTETGQQITVDGVEIEFQLTPDTEAPAEMNFLLPRYRALCMAENCTHNLHNVYTLRGAQVRDAMAWAYFIDEAIGRFEGRYNVIFASHHWPTWGADACVRFLKEQRDMYKYLHDQTMRLANQGYIMLEIPELINVPPALSKAWYNRGYYGSINHNVKAIYQRYLGFFDGNPAHLHPLPPQEAAKNYVDFMGGLKTC
jgi:alkyl sulfatase BDS1-like metallo-beta-lactamase superfamily hydrolase